MKRYVQALEYTKGAESKLFAEHREEAVKHRSGPAEF
jgi:hypothetical protein